MRNTIYGEVMRMPAPTALLVWLLLQMTLPAAGALPDATATPTPTPGGWTCCQGQESCLHPRFGDCFAQGGIEYFYPYVCDEAGVHCVLPGTLVSTPTPALPCVGDCDGDGQVLINELVQIVDDALDGGSKCPAAAQWCPLLGVACAVSAVRNALQGCTIPAGRCRDMFTDCNILGVELCVEPGDYIGCGICFSDQQIDEMFHRCTADSDCGYLDDVGICQQLGRASGTCPPCSGPDTVCMIGCSGDAECDAAAMCDEHRCVARVCDTDQDCPMHYGCSSTANGLTKRCVRRSCGSDNDCAGGFCVNGACYAELGRCIPIPA